MARCDKQVGYDKSGHSGSRCPKKARHFFRIDYGYAEQNLVKVLGVCDDHIKGASSIRYWGLPDFYLYGVKKATPVVESDHGEDQRQKHLESVKEQFAHILQTKSNSKFTYEDWVEMFRSVLDELQVKKVMGE